MPRVLVTETIADRGLDLLRAAGHEVDVRLDCSPEQLVQAVKGAAALIVRSATQVTGEVLSAATDMVVVGRAGIGVDNIDVGEATRLGVLVVNAPQSNVLSAAEHSVALLLSQARNIPQAHAALREGRWERSKWEGVELYGKTLGVVGLGRVGALVAQRALAFDMRVIAYDPFVSDERARQMNVDLVDLDDLVAQSDFVTIHLPKTPETVGLFNKELLAKAKPGQRLINTARGGIVDEAALAEAVRSGQLAGAAVDVFATEPTTESPLFEVENIVVTPHLGASTQEAQDKAGFTIAEQVLLALAGEFVPFGVNVSAAEASETVRQFMPLAELLGRIYVRLSAGLPNVLELTYEGQLAEYDTRLLTLSLLRGALSATTDQPVTFVNASQLAAERGVDVRVTTTSAQHDYVNLITIRGGEHSLAGTLAGRSAQARIVMIDDHDVEVVPATDLLLVRNDDRPGMVGVVGTALGEAGVSVSNMAVGQSPKGDTALMILATDRPVPGEVLERLTGAPGILALHVIHN